MSEPQAPLLQLRDGHVATLRFNRPAMLNAIDAETAQLFLASCRQLAADPGVRVVVLCGEGRAFVAGGDLKLMRTDPASVPATLIDPLHEAMLLLANMKAPVIASLKGSVAGAGMSLALGCDLAIAAADTRFTLAYLNVGTTCDLSGSWSLPRIVGLRRALGIALLNEPVDAVEALRLGLVNRVVPNEELEAQTLALAQRLAAGPPVAIGNMKRLLRESLQHGLAEQLDRERRSFAECAATADFHEAVSAFLQKRPPQFTGR